MRETTSPPFAFALRQAGTSRSFPEGFPLAAPTSGPEAPLLLLGDDAATLFVPDPRRSVVLVELGLDPLSAVAGEETANVVGFARFRLGDASPSSLVELVRQPTTAPDAIAAATALFEAAGLTVALCHDFAGRIVDRLIRPHFNKALDALDERLATAADLELALVQGLGYRKGILAPLEAGGLAHHHDVTKALFAVYGQQAYAPARRALAAKRRSERAQAAGRRNDEAAE